MSGKHPKTKQTRALRWCCAWSTVQNLKMLSSNNHIREAETIIFIYICPKTLINDESIVRIVAVHLPVDPSCCIVWHTHTQNTNNYKICLIALTKDTFCCDIFHLKPQVTSSSLRASVSVEQYGWRAAWGGKWSCSMNQNMQLLFSPPFTIW